MHTSGIFRVVASCCAVCACLFTIDCAPICFFDEKILTLRPLYKGQMNKFEKSLRFISDKIQPESPFYGKIFLVGGCVRDELLGERYSDLDLLINLPNGQKEFVEHMCQTYPNVCKGPFYYQRYGTTAMDVEIDGTITLVECVEPHIESYDTDGVTLLETRFCTLEEDAMRRDYTCNALYKNLSTGEILDPTGRGIDDLRHKLLRTPAEPNLIFRQDPVRMLRGIRFKHQKGFSLADDAWQAIIQQHDEMQKASPKRLRDELNKMLKARSFGEGIHDLYASGLLDYVIPALPQFIADPTPLPNGDGVTTLWEHTRKALHVLGREHSHSETMTKLTILVLDVADMHGIQAATQVLISAQIGKERIASIVHNIQMYLRFRAMFDGGNYVARPRVLPHFLTAINSHKTEFRRMVRALNHGLAPQCQVPYQLLYDEDNEKRAAKRSRAADTRSPEQIKADRNHRRNQKRRYKRKASRKPTRPTNNGAQE